MRSFVRWWVLVIALAVGLSACDEECQEPPGTFEPVEGCEVHLDAGENVFAFCVNPPPEGCGPPGGPNAQSWLATLQASSADSPKPTRVGCGPVAPSLFPTEGANNPPEDCCWLMVYDHPEEEYCVETEF